MLQPAIAHLALLAQPGCYSLQQLTWPCWASQAATSCYSSPGLVGSARLLGCRPALVTRVLAWTMRQLEAGHLQVGHLQAGHSQAGHSQVRLHWARQTAWKEAVAW